ncbi:MAG: universal stress protein [Gemmatimonadaceae bacterium]
MKFSLERILVAIDGSAASLAAARFAIDVAASRLATVRAVAVVGKDRDERIAAQLIDRVGEGADSQARRRAALEDAVAHLVRLGTEAGVTVERALRVSPDREPYDVILDEADEWRAHVVVVGRGSHRGIGRALLGSQAEHLLEFAMIPVIVVPQPAD